MYACKTNGPATWYFDAVLTRALVVSYRIRSPYSNGTRGCLGLCKPHASASASASASPSPGIWCDDPGEIQSMPLVFPFLELHIDLRTSVVDSFRIAVEFSVNSAWQVSGRSALVGEPR